MINSANPKSPIPDIVINAIPASGSANNQGHIPVADAVPSLKTAGSGFAILTGTIYAYDKTGNAVGYKNLNYLIPSGGVTPVDDSMGEDLAVQFSVSLVLDGRKNATFDVSNTGTSGAIDVVITDLQVRYFGT